METLQDIVEACPQGQGWARMHPTQFEKITGTAPQVGTGFHGLLDGRIVLWTEADWEGPPEVRSGAHEYGGIADLAPSDEIFNADGASVHIELGANAFDVEATDGLTVEQCQLALLALLRHAQLIGHDVNDVLAAVVR